MKSEVAQNGQTHDLPLEPFEPKMVPSAPSRLIRPMMLGIIIEVLTIVALLVTIASGQFSIYSYVLGMLGVLTPILLAARSFWLMSQDERRLQIMMREWERARIVASPKEGSRPFIPTSEPTSLVSSKELVHI
jgi:hypothetical protein